MTIGNTYYIRVYDYGTIAPTDPAFEICVTGQPPVTEPDLEIISGSANPDSIEPRETTDLTYTIVNSGAGTVDNASVTGYYLVPVSQGCPTDIPPGSPFFQGLLDVSEMVDNTETEVHTVTIPSGTAPDDYYLVIVTDWELEVAEEDETNNIFCVAITVTAPIVLPVNDDCANAISLTPNLTCINTSGTLLDATASGVAAASCDLFGSPALLDVWYSFTATATAHDILQTANPNFDGIIVLYSACGGSEFFCADDNAIGENETISATDLTIGSTYYIRVYDYGTIAPTDPTFEICVTTPIVTGIESVLKEMEEFLVYPNPTNGLFTVEMDMKTRSEVEIAVFNAVGQQVYGKAFSQQKGSFRQPINLQNFAAGMYHVQITIGTKVLRRSVNVVRD
ncbi:MAG: T9SS type A sorting domain-containing protein [Flavobacteriales bacterium]|nr:T9SS type A sorting domain-containing protein [Flavobacteriales bacterium]